MLLLLFFICATYDCLSLFRSHSPFPDSLLLLDAKTQNRIALDGMTLLLILMTNLQTLVIIAYLVLRTLSYF